MHRLTDKKFSLREKIMATFMFILSAVLVFIIYKTNGMPINSKVTFSVSKRQSNVVYGFDL